MFRPLALALFGLTVAGSALAQTQPVFTDGFRRDLLLHCDKLRWQFDGAMAKSRLPGNVERASALRNSGSQLCRSGQPFEGIEMLHAALRMVGVIPAPAPVPGPESTTGAASFRR